MSKKRLIKNKPLQGEYAVYSFLDENPSINYLDSDGVAIRYDKFTKQDLYSYSIGDNVNAAICESKILNALDPFDPVTNPEGVSRLRFTGGSFLEIILNQNITNLPNLLKAAGIEFKSEQTELGC